MSKVAYIASLVYFPAIVFYMIFAGESMIWDKLYFFLEKGLLCTFIIRAISVEIIPQRKRLFFSLLLLNIVFLVYICIDWGDVFVMGWNTVVIATIIYLIVLILNIMLYDRKN
jgi:hypothetical protein